MSTHQSRGGGDGVAASGGSLRRRRAMSAMMPGVSETVKWLMTRAPGVQMGCIFGGAVLVAPTHVSLTTA